MRKILVVASLILSVFLNGCATVPMASVESDKERKEFSPPSQGSAGLYIYRNSALGGALKKSVYVDGQLVGETAPMTYFYKEVEPGKRILSTESEFSNNDLTLDAKTGQNYFVRQYIKLGVFVGGANLEIVSEEKGKKGVLQCKLANTFDNDSFRSNSIGSTSVIEFYGEAEEEVNTDSYNKDLWAKALVEVEGDETKRKAKYIELRANQLYSEKVGAVSGTSSYRQAVPVTLGTPIDLSGTYISDITSNSKEFFGNTDGKLVFTLVQTADRITAVNSTYQLKIGGTRKGNMIEFFVEPHRLNHFLDQRGVWEINPDGINITGSWKVINWGGAGQWNLRRIE